ncbi:MAG: non-canonical purine NTP pyrophosphatase [Thermoplasmata archaeon]|nr:non-canonical purine NTP pyrophosphatase [Thermoplasmata archaeon]
MDVRFVSSNRNKFREVAEILTPFGIRTQWERRTLAEPQADRLEAVVRAKLASLPSDGRTYLVEDSGLFLDGLDGFPGVYAAYAYGTIGLPGILRLLRCRSRAAEFRTVAGVRHPAGTWWVAGSVRGTVPLKARGSRGFGYDPIFVPDGERRTFAEMAPVEKNRHSHRGRAVRRAGARLARESAAPSTLPAR